MGCARSLLGKALEILLDTMKKYDSHGLYMYGIFPIIPGCAENFEVLLFVRKSCTYTLIKITLEALRLAPSGLGMFNRYVRTIFFLIFKREREDLTQM